MNKSLLSIGIVLFLGSVGCAGVGLQHASSLVPELQREQGLDNLWVSPARARAEALEVPLYAEDHLGSLWDSTDRVPTVTHDAGFYEGRSLGDLWNPRSVTRSWEAQPKQGLVSRDSVGRMRASRDRSAAQ